MGWFRRNTITIAFVFTMAIVTLAVERTGDISRDSVRTMCAMINLNTAESNSRIQTNRASSKGIVDLAKIQEGLAKEQFKRTSDERYSALADDYASIYRYVQQRDILLAQTYLDCEQIAK